MTIPFEPPDDATPEPAPEPPEQWAAQGPQETQRVSPVPSPNHYSDPWAAPAPSGFGYNSAVHPAPPPVPAWTPTPTNGLATSGMVLGIVAACLFWVPVVNGVLAILAIVLGGVGWAKSRQLNGLGKGKGITGVVLGVVTLVGWFVFWAAVLGSAGTAASTAIAAAPDSTYTAPSAAEAATTDTSPAPLTAKDVKLAVKTISKDCFDGYGCNVTLEISNTWRTAPQSGDRYQITYKLTGGTEPVEGTIYTTDGGTERSSEFITTRRASAKVKVVVTDVTRL